MHTYEMVTEHFANQNLSVVVAKCCFYGLWCETEPLCVQSLTFMTEPLCSLDLDDQIFGCLLALMAAVQAGDVGASFLFAGDLNGHHQEWLDSTTTNRHGVAAFDFTTVSDCNQLVVVPTHARGGTLACGGSQITPLCQQSFRWLRQFQTCV